MKRWLPFAISVLAHVLVIGWLASTQLSVSKPKEKQNKPLRAVLIAPPIVKKQESQKPELNTEVPVPSASEPEPPPELEQVPAQEKATELKIAPIQQPIETTKQVPMTQPVPDTSLPSLSSSSIAEATRRALGLLQKGANQQAASDAQKYFAERDKRIIADAPKLNFEDERKLEWKRPSLKVDCADDTSKALTMVSGLFGGTVQCHSYSAKDVNRFIQRRLNKLPADENEVGQKR